MEIGGYEAPNLRKLADKIAASGFLVVAPDFFYGDPFGLEKSRESWLEAHSPDKGCEDAKIVIDDLRSKGVSKIGVAGFCWGEVKIPIAILGAEIDKHAPPELLKKLGDILSAKAEVDSFVKIFPGVGHGWTVRYKDDDEFAVKTSITRSETPFPGSGLLPPRTISSFPHGTRQVLRLYDVDESEVRLETPTTRGAALLDCCFESESVALTANSDGSVVRYDMRLGNSNAIGKHDDAATCVEYSEETCQIITSGWDNSIKFWDARSGRVDSMSISVFNLMVALKSSVHIYDLRYLDREVRVNEPFTDIHVNCVRSNSNLGGFMTGSIDGRVALEYFGDSGSQKCGYAFKCHPKSKDGRHHLVAVNDIAFNPVLCGVITGDNEGHATMWDVQSRRHLMELPRYPNSVASLAYNHDGQLLAVASSFTYQEANERELPPQIFLHQMDDIQLTSAVEMIYNQMQGPLDPICRIISKLFCISTFLKFYGNAFSKIYRVEMASGASKSAAFMLLVLNIVLYLIVIFIASWAVNHGIERSHKMASVLSLPAQIFPIYYPFGNSATGFVVLLSLIAGVVGFTTSVTGIGEVIQWDAPNLHAAATSSLISWLLTMLSMGLACKEIDIGWTDSNLVKDLRTLETILILLGGTQLFCTAAIYIGVDDLDVVAEYKISMHCNACEKSVAKVISKIKGVEKIVTDMTNNKVVVTGKIDPHKVLKKLKKKTGKRVELLFLEDPNAKKDEEERIEDNNKQVMMNSWMVHYYGEGEMHMMFNDENPNACWIM
ncbi:heavy metal transport/detoxification superfamily protein [Striga asiatica]|uniref:Heavy metal transport/detoxification superfamily protein n=1 Tax=Striga asiatica TaxID=4170 RepID=A0A5A7PXW2_STRAF|nr:heavy metal transport/detoxification superfamily protein [Striga asiatica]